MTIIKKNIRLADEYDINLNYSNISIKNSIKDICDFFELDLKLKIYDDVINQLDQNDIQNLDIQTALTVTKGSYNSVGGDLVYGYKVYEIENTNSINATKLFLKMVFKLKNISANSNHTQALSFCIDYVLCNNIDSSGNVLDASNLLSNTLGNTVFDDAGYAGTHNNISMSFTQINSPELSYGSYDKTTGRLLFIIFPHSKVELGQQVHNHNIIGCKFGLYIEKIYKNENGFIDDYVMHMQLCRSLNGVARDVYIQRLIQNINLNTNKVFEKASQLFLPIRNVIVAPKNISAVKIYNISPITNRISTNDNVLLYNSDFIPKSKIISILGTDYVAINKNLTGCIFTNEKYGFLIKV